MNRRVLLSCAATAAGVLSACSGQATPPATTVPPTTIVAYTPADSFDTVRSAAIYIARTAEVASETENRGATQADIAAAGEAIAITGVTVSTFDETRNRVVVSADADGVGVRACVELLEARAVATGCDNAALDLSVPDTDDTGS